MSASERDPTAVRPQAQRPLVDLSLRHRRGAAAELTVDGRYVAMLDDGRVSSEIRRAVSGIYQWQLDVSGP